MSFSTHAWVNGLFPSCKEHKSSHHLLTALHDYGIHLFNNVDFSSSVHQQHGYLCVVLINSKRHGTHTFLQALIIQVREEGIVTDSVNLAYILNFVHLDQLHGQEVFSRSSSCPVEWLASKQSTGYSGVENCTWVPV